MIATDLNAAALSLRGGGVGYYPESGFVHLDIGRRRRSRPHGCTFAGNDSLESFSAGGQGNLGRIPRRLLRQCDGRIDHRPLQDRIWSATKDLGKDSTTSNWPHWNGSTGSTTGGSSVN